MIAPGQGVSEQNIHFKYTDILHAHAVHYGKMSAPGRDFQKFQITILILIPKRLFILTYVPLFIPNIANKNKP